MIFSQKQKKQPLLKLFYPLRTIGAQQWPSKSMILALSIIWNTPNFDHSYLATPKIFGLVIITTSNVFC
jgi:predicted ABC-class ATPase